MAIPTATETPQNKGITESLIAFGASQQGLTPDLSHYLAPLREMRLVVISAKLCSLWLQSTNLSLGVTNFWGMTMVDKSRMMLVNYKE